MKKLVLCFLVLSFAVSIFMSCGDVYNYENCNNTYNYTESDANEGVEGK